VTGPNDNVLDPFHVFRFQVDFVEERLGTEEPGGPVVLASGAFSACSGLEATMEPKVIQEGGRNASPHQRVGPVTYGTVVLKRGMTSTQHLWQWFELVASGGSAYRLSATVTLYDTAGRGALAWRLARALPVKFKAADLDAASAEVGIEELHLAHEGLTMAEPAERLGAGGAA
jgi:phage tail-like protein